MKYCAYCGKELVDEAVICSGCGCPTDLYKNPADSKQQFSQNQSSQNNQSTVPVKTNTYAILSIIFAFLSPILGIIFGKVGLNEIKKDKNQKGEELAKAGLGLSIAFLVLSVLIVIGVVIALVFISNNYSPDIGNQDEIGLKIIKIL